MIQTQIQMTMIHIPTRTRLRRALRQLRRMSEGDEDAGVENVNVSETETETETDTGHIAPTDQALVLVYPRRPHIPATDIRIIHYLDHRKTSSPQHPIEPSCQNCHLIAASTGVHSQPPSIPTLTPILFMIKELSEPTPKLENANSNGRSVNASASRGTMVAVDFLGR